MVEVWDVREFGHKLFRALKSGTSSLNWFWKCNGIQCSLYNIGAIETLHPSGLHQLHLNLLKFAVCL